MYKVSRLSAWAFFFGAAALLFPARPAADGLSKGLRAMADRDTVCNVWVFFSGKERGAAEKVSERAALRRRRADFADGESGRPISQGYVREIERRGGKLRALFPWGNAASFSVHASRLDAISSLPFVKSVAPVAVYVRNKTGNLPSPHSLAKSSAFKSDSSGYGWHTEMVGVPLAHDYIKSKKLGAPGNGVLMAFFDSGFRLDHVAYARVRDSGQVKASRDFVDGGAAVFDPDTTLSSIRSPYDRHGAQTLAFAAAYHPGVYLGTAWGAKFALARTEDNAVESRVEEDNWAAAVVWADSLGADIISSSLGYRDGFTDSTENYTYPDMDGATTVISIAAAGAVKRGMVVVNSAGNEGVGTTLGTITAPADVDGVVAVGAVDQNRMLAGFSGAGPTYDGRMKPDVAAPGAWAPTVEPSDSAAYTVGSGTSFAAPIVSAITALILQANPGISEEEVRARLYASCGFAYGQTLADNRFGRGIPNAALAVMGRDEIFLKVTDTAGRALPGAVITAGADAYTADEFGGVIIKAQMPSLPAELKVSYRGSRALNTVTVGALPFASVVELGAARDEGLRVSPNITKKHGVIRARYLFAGADASAPAVATVRTLTGKKVWGQKLKVRPDGSAEFVWDCKTRRVAAGVYVVMVKQGYNVVSEKVVISN